jgi:hypothetical protein
MKEWRRHCQLVNYILTEHDKQQAKILPLKLIDGYDIMDMCDLEPGPLIGELLTMVNEAHASGEINTREEALALVQSGLSTLGIQQTTASQKSQISGVKQSLTHKVD